VGKIRKVRVHHCRRGRVAWLDIPMSSSADHATPRPAFVGKIRRRVAREMSSGEALNTGGRRKPVVKTVAPPTPHRDQMGGAAARRSGVGLAPWPHALPVPVAALVLYKGFHWAWVLGAAAAAWLRTALKKKTQLKKIRPGPALVMVTL
jgi:hypothetical protein